MSLEETDALGILSNDDGDAVLRQFLLGACTAQIHEFIENGILKPATTECNMEGNTCSLDIVFEESHNHFRISVEYLGKEGSE